VTSIIRALADASSSSSSTSTIDLDSFDNYLEIRASACGEPMEGGHLVCMVAMNGDPSHNRSNRYPTIGRSEVSDARNPSDGLVQNMNLNFNMVWIQAIMETIQHMALDGPLANKGLRQQTWSSWRSRLEFPGGNFQLETMIRQDMPEVRLCHRHVQIAVCPSMMHDTTSPRTAPHGNMAINGMTSATSSKIGGVSGSEHHPHHDGL
jgi:hypothetical protein